jgi:hypothetical protein
MPTKKSRQKILPAILKGRMINADLKDAVCGSPHKCALAHMLLRIIDPEPTFVSVKENRITITWRGMLHHYELTRQALKLVAMNDDGTLTLSPTESHVLRLPRVRVMKAHIDLSPERREQIKASNKRRAEAGITSPRNPRLLAAKQAGVALKKLSAVIAKQTAVATTAEKARHLFAPSS